MSVYLRGKIWWCKFSFDGERIRRSTGATKKREALKFERDLRTELENDRTARNNEPVFGNAVIQWLKEDAPKSMHSHIRNTNKHLARVPLSQVPEKAHLMKIDMLNAGLSVQTINRRLAVVRRVLNLSFKRWNYLTQPLGEKIELFSEKGCAREVFLEREEVKSLVGHMESETARHLTLLAAFTGLRRSELLKLEPKNWRSPYIILSSKTKSKKPRSIPLVNELHFVMEHLPFQITGHELRKNFEDAREKMKRPDVRFHDLRHTFASWLAKDPSVPMLMIKELLGHSSLLVTSKYAHLRGDGAEIIENVLGTMGGHNGDDDVLH